MFWDNYVRLCNSVGEAPNVVAAKVGVKSSGTVTGWKKGAMPREAVLLALSEYFGVTVEYLLTGEQKKPALPKEDEHEIGEFKRALLDAVDDMSEAERMLLMERIQKIKESRQ